MREIATGATGRSIDRIVGPIASREPPARGERRRARPGREMARVNNKLLSSRKSSIPQIGGAPESGPPLRRTPLTGCSPAAGGPQLAQAPATSSQLVAGD